MATKKDKNRMLLIVLGIGTALYFLSKKSNAGASNQTITLPVGDPDATDLAAENVPPLRPAILPDTGPTYAAPPETEVKEPVLTKPTITPIETIPIHGGYTPGGGSGTTYGGNKPWDAVLPYNADDHLQ